MFDSFAEDLFDVYVDTLSSIEVDWSGLPAFVAVGVAYSVLLSAKNIIESKDIENLMKLNEIESLKGGVNNA